MIRLLTLLAILPFLIAAAPLWAVLRSYYGSVFTIWLAVAWLFTVVAMPFLLVELESPLDMKLIGSWAPYHPELIQALAVAALPLWLLHIIVAVRRSAISERSTDLAYTGHIIIGYGYRTMLDVKLIGIYLILCLMANNSDHLRQFYLGGEFVYCGSVMMAGYFMVVLAGGPDRIIDAFAGFSFPRCPPKPATVRHAAHAPAKEGLPAILSRRHAELKKMAQADQLSK